MKRTRKARRRKKIVVWLLAADVVRQRRRALGSMELALGEISAALRQGRLRSQRRSLKDGVIRTEELSMQDWRDVYLIAQITVSQSERGFPQYGPFTGRVFVKEWDSDVQVFLAEADCRKLWPAPKQQPPKAIASPQQRTGGRPPEYDWGLLHALAGDMFADKGPPVSGKQAEFLRQLLRRARRLKELEQEQLGAEKKTKTKMKIPPAETARQYVRQWIKDHRRALGLPDK